MIVNKRYKQDLKPFLSRLVNISKQRHIPNLEEYIKEHKWKLRASGNDIGSKTKVLFPKQFPTFVANVSNAQKTIEHWLPVLCEYNIMGEGKKSLENYALIRLSIVLTLRITQNMTIHSSYMRCKILNWCNLLKELFIKVPSA